MDQKAHRRREASVQDDPASPPFPEARQFRHPSPDTEATGNHTRAEDRDPLLDHLHLPGGDHLRNAENTITTTYSR